MAPMALEADDKTRQRARWEAFAFVLPTAGKVNVANHSYGEADVAAHTYTVTVDGGGPIECTCPAFTYHCRPGEACKHMVTVAETEPVLQAALASLDGADGREGDE